MAELPNEQVRAVLRPAYGPCEGFAGNCGSMIYKPNEGHIPRGFCGATGALEDVRLLLVCAEPGDPLSTENYGGTRNPDALLKSACFYAWQCFETERDLFHWNIRCILNLCFPCSSFTEQMRYAMITDAVLCSAKEEGGYVGSPIAKECAQRYLLKLIKILPNATIAALGRKARQRLFLAGLSDRSGVSDRYFVPASSAAPPGCYQKRAWKSWEEIAKVVSSHTSAPYRQSQR
jgi:hypothetical protein